MDKIEFQTVRALRLLGISCRGLQYYKTAVQMILDKNPNNLTCNALYRYVAEQYRTTSEVVEASMRYSLDRAYRDGSLALLNEWYDGEVIRNYRPNLLDVLGLITDYLRCG